MKISPFYKLGNDKEGTKAMFLEAGFNEVKMWYQPVNWMYRDGEEYVKAFHDEVNPIVKEDMAVRNECIRLFNENCKDSVRTFEVLVILAYKD